MTSKKKTRVRKTRNKPAAKAGGKYTKNQALLDAMRAGGGTREELVAATDKLYVKRGGESAAAQRRRALHRERAREG
jgi:hypothetical protein